MSRTRHVTVTLQSRVLEVQSVLSLPRHIHSFCITGIPLSGDKEAHQHFSRQKTPNHTCSSPASTKHAHVLLQNTVDTNFYHSHLYMRPKSYTILLLPKSITTSRYTSPLCIHLYFVIFISTCKKFLSLASQTLQMQTVTRGIFQLLNTS